MSYQLNDIQYTGDKSPKGSDQILYTYSGGASKARPPRVFYDAKLKRYYILVKGKRQYIKIRSGMTIKEVQSKIMNKGKIQLDLSKTSKPISDEERPAYKSVRPMLFAPAEQVATIPLEKYSSIKTPKERDEYLRSLKPKVTVNRRYRSLEQKLLHERLTPDESYEYVTLGQKLRSDREQPIMVPKTELKYDREQRPTRSLEPPKIKIVSKPPQLDITPLKEEKASAGLLGTHSPIIGYRHVGDQTIPIGDNAPKLLIVNDEDDLGDVPFNAFDDDRDSSRVSQNQGLNLATLTLPRPNNVLDRDSSRVSQNNVLDRTPVAPNTEEKKSKEVKIQTMPFNPDTVLDRDSSRVSQNNVLDIDSSRVSQNQGLNLATLTLPRPNNVLDRDSSRVSQNNVLDNLYDKAAAEVKKQSTTIRKDQMLRMLQNYGIDDAADFPQLRSWNGPSLDDGQAAFIKERLEEIMIYLDREDIRLLYDVLDKRGYDVKPSDDRNELIKKMMSYLTPEEWTSLREDLAEVSEIEVPLGLGAIARMFGKGNVGDEINLKKTHNGVKLPALYDDEIAEFFKDYPNFGGVIASDQIDDLPKKLPIGFVMNTTAADDDSFGHWVAVYINGDSIEYFDPLGDKASDDFKKRINKYIKSLNLPVMMKFKENKIIQQHGNSHRCGYHSIRFLDDRMSGLDFPLASRFSKGTTVNNSKAGEDVIKSEFRYL